MEIRISQLKSAPEVSIPSYISGFCVRLFFCKRGMLQDLPISSATVSYLNLLAQDSCRAQRPKGVKSVPKYIILSKTRFSFSKPLSRRSHQLRIDLFIEDELSP